MLQKFEDINVEQYVGVKDMRIAALVIGTTALMDRIHI
jgi:hypothetical protein